MAHGYLREYDEDLSEQRERWREGNERDWRANERNVGFMLGDRGRSWEHDDVQRRGSSRADWERAPRNFSSRQDDHYRSWRNKQIDALDRDYAEYCREREQQFHSDFDAWRNRRHGNPGPLRTGMTQTGMSHDPSGTLELNETADQTMGQPDPMATATLGTSSSRTRR